MLFLQDVRRLALHPFHPDIRWIDVIKPLWLEHTGFSVFLAQVIGRKNKNEACDRIEQAYCCAVSQLLLFNADAVHIGTDNVGCLVGRWAV